MQSPRPYRSGVGFRKPMKTGLAGLFALSLGLAGCDGAQDSTQDIGTNAEKAVVEEMTSEARYTEDRQLIRPTNWREWIFVGMPVTPNALNGGR